MPGENEDKVTTHDLDDIEISDDELASFDSEETFEREEEEQQDETSDESEETENDEEEESESEEEGETEESSEESEETGEEEMVLEIDGETYDEEYLTESVKDRKNKESWQKSNTEKAQKIAAISKKLKTVNDALKKEELLDALDEYFDGKDNNPFRGLDLEVESESSADDDTSEESKTDLDKRVEALESIETERTQESEKVAQAEKISEVVDREVSELEALDKEMKKPKVVQKVIDFAVKYSDEHPDERPMSLKEAWLETRGKNLMTTKKITDEAEDGNKSVPGKSKGIKSTKRKTPAKDIDEATDDAVKAYHELESK